MTHDVGTPGFYSQRYCGHCGMDTVHLPDGRCLDCTHPRLCTCGHAWPSHLHDPYQWDRLPCSRCDCRGFERHYGDVAARALVRAS